MQIRLVVIALVSTLVSARADAQFRAADPAPGETFTVELGLMLWTPTPKLGVQTDGLAALGVPHVDLAEAFALDDTRFTEFRIVLKPGRKHKLRIARVSFSYDQQGTAPRPLNLGGLILPPSQPLTTQVEWDLWRFGYEWDFVAADRGLFGLVTEVKYNRLAANVGAAGIGSEAIDVTAPLATLGLIGRVYPHRNVALTAEFTGVKLFGLMRRVSDAFVDDLDVKMYDVDLYGTVNFGRHVGVQGGYRSVSADFEIEGDSGDLEMKGLYFGGLVRF
jgi:hypothetical protein